MTTDDSIELYGDDDSHPIPRLDVCDVNGVKNFGGADLVLIIASPLKADFRSQKRLIRKLRNYLRFIKSVEFASQAGPPSPANTTIVVSIHPDSDPETFDLLERSRGWILDNQASLVIERVRREG